MSERQPSYDNLPEPEIIHKDYALVLAVNSLLNYRPYSAWHTITRADVRQNPADTFVAFGRKICNRYLVSEPLLRIGDETIGWEVPSQVAVNDALSSLRHQPKRVPPQPALRAIQVSSLYPLSDTVRSYEKYIFKFNASGELSYLQTTNQFIIDGKNDAPATTDYAVTANSIEQAAAPLVRALVLVKAAEGANSVS